METNTDSGIRNKEQLGVYFHIPFCKKACHYCDFHFSTSLKMKQGVLDSMHRELDSRQSYLRNENIETIYFGGGTPSILNSEEIKSFIEHCNKLFSVSDDAEITLEANPDDLTREKILEFKAAGINRLSIGIQSFREEDLIWMNRAHSAEEAINSIKLAQEEGIENITIDLIYGIPGLSDDDWRKNIETAIALNVPHISAYCLTVENGTALADFVKKKKAKPVDEDQSSRQFLMMMEMLRANDFITYEISNFGKQGYFSRHNSSYWKGKHYLGIGPSAHSYNGVSRSYNVSNNARYVKGINEGTSVFETEVLSTNNRFNEYIMTRLRTIWGVNEEFISQEFGRKFADHFRKESLQWKDSGHLIPLNGNLILSDSGRLLADKIIGEIFIS